MAHCRRRRRETSIKSDLISVVVIDDNVGSLELISAALMLPGLQVFATSKPEDGLDLISRHQPEIVITDLVMPGMSGFEVLAWTREFDPGIDVIVMSALDSGELSAKATQEGAVEYLRKPIALSVVRESVRRIIQNRVPDRAQPLDFANSPNGSHMNPHFG